MPSPTEPAPHQPPASPVRPPSPAAPPPTAAFCIEGYYPLYGTLALSDAASPSGSSHTHELRGETYFMPNGFTGATHGGSCPAQALPLTPPPPSPPSAPVVEIVSTLAAGALGEDSELVVSLQGSTPVSQVVVQVTYDPSVASLKSATAVPGSPLDTVVAAAALDASGRVSVSLTATGGTITSGPVARVVIRRLAAGSVSVSSLTSGMQAMCVGCNW